MVDIYLRGNVHTVLVSAARISITSNLGSNIVQYALSASCPCDSAQWTLTAMDTYCMLCLDGVQPAQFAIWPTADRHPAVPPARHAAGSFSAAVTAGILVTQVSWRNHVRGGGNDGRHTDTHSLSRPHQCTA